MTAFWTLYWLGFIGLPLLFLLARQIKSKGYKISSSHVMVVKGTHRKFSNATVRQAWEHENPGQTWEDHEKSQQIAYFIMMAIVYVICLAWLATRLFTLPQDPLAQKLFQQIGAPILGGLFAVLVILFQTRLANYRSAIFRVIHIISLVVMALGVIVALVLTFVKGSLAVSSYWLFAPLGVMGLSFLLDAVIFRSKDGKYRRTAAKGEYKLDAWVVEVLKMSYARPTGDLKEDIWKVQLMLDRGQLWLVVKEKEFFYLTEAIMLDLVAGKPIPIMMKEIYEEQEFVIKTVQRFYAYMVKTYDNFSVHPRIKKAVRQ